MDGPASRPRFGARFVIAALVVAVLDIGFAIAYWVGYRGLTTPARILRSIASGLLGPSAMQGGTGVTILGAALHLLVATIWTAILVLALRALPSLDRVLRRAGGALRVGIPFGVLVWLVMNFVVTPLAHGQATPLSKSSFWVMLVWHAIGVGMPMALLLRAGRYGPTSLGTT